VGGHAVNLWAFVYREKIGSSLDQWLPLTSKDLDLVGTNALLEAAKDPRIMNFVKHRLPG
jgi:hypothetical protein